MMYNGENLPYKVGMDEITYQEDSAVRLLGFITDYPDIAYLGKTKEEILEKINRLLTTLSVLR